MSIQRTDESLTTITADWLIVAIHENQEFSAPVAALDHALSGVLTLLRERGDLVGKLGDLLILPAVAGIAAQRVAVVGLGEVSKLTLGKLQRAMLNVARKVQGEADRVVAVQLPTEAFAALGPVAVETLVYAFVIGGSGQDLYKAERSRFPAKSISLLGGDATLDDSIQRGRILGEAANLTRELVNRHPGEMNPEAFANRAADVAADLGIHGQILERHQLEQERMGALLAVAQGSSCEPRVVVLKYEGAGSNSPYLGLCGKGVTFDSGGLSIKPSASMIAMKADMAGAATVLGAMVAIARLKLPVNVIGVMGLVENMVSGGSYRLGDVLTARNGVTIEVHNTDAEGRLVLADILSYTVDQGVERLVDLATLTGSCVVALGEEVTGVFSNNEEFSHSILQAACSAGEDAWPMPMYDSFAEQLNSDFADTKNVGTRWGGAITAAKFLEKFVGDTPWIHLDIAGPAYAEAAKPYQDAGGTGAMVRTLVHLASSLASTGGEPA